MYPKLSTINPGGTREHYPEHTRELVTMCRSRVIYNWLPEKGG